ncbi:hypothetical protein CLV39_0093 [Hydrogenothermus marinus]|uniref:Flagellar protein FliO/FliZ n=2 Tax=Hydrogenothermus marinus TaxID=133270 RepID=A0A3M0BJH8_9AQUI|nr:hypothetical protein CLV39_0093 [Hydrogenothermus marinus]
MFEGYDLLKFLLSFLFIIGLIYGFYFLFMRYGSKFSITPKSNELKIKDIRFLTKDKGFIIVQLKDKQFFFTFDNQNGLKLIEKIKQDNVDEKD